ncbi:MFS general substrate transporter [Xylaria nigripes]|nr:MFS general substrate transporter [Xylaria nigripes]
MSAEAPKLDDAAKVEAHWPSVTDSEAAEKFNWNDDPANPYNWPQWRKNIQLFGISLIAFTASIGSSIISPAHQQLIDEFGVSSSVAFLTLSTYILALGTGPVFGGPLSEIVGRKGVYIGGTVLGALFALGAGFTNSIAGLCVLRFLSGFAFGPTLSITSGFFAEVYTPAQRGMPSTLFTLSPFLGPGFGPVLGVFLVERLSWRWTQYIMVFLAIFSLIWVVFSKESYHPIVQEARMRELGMSLPDSQPPLAVSKELLTTGFLRPLHMMLTEPMLGCLCLYVAFIFGVLFSFFGAFFYVFESVYGFTLEQSGLVFLAIGVGCVLGVLNAMLCDRLFYTPQISKHPPHKVPPEYRLFPAMVGSLAIPISLFLFAWTTRRSISPALPIVAVVIFGAGNISVFIGSTQYCIDAYHRSNIASAMSANSLARYLLAAVFPLFSLQLFQDLGVAWASSLLGFVSLALLPLPWLFFKFGKTLRSKSRYETASY